jgi:putative DNA primase/helicase
MSACLRCGRLSETDLCMSCERFEAERDGGTEFVQTVAADASDALLVVPPPDNPMAVARDFLMRHYMRGADLLLRHHRGSFHRWAGTCWPEDEGRRVKSHLYHWLERASYRNADGEFVPFKPNAKKVSEVAQALAAIGHVSELLNRPCWLDGREATDHLAMANGLLRLSTRTVEPHQPAFFNEHALPFDFDRAAPQPTRWLNFLRELWPDDEESIECLAEVMGYVLGGSTEQQKIFMLVGPPRSGKGTIGRVLTGLLGPHNVAAPTLAALTQNFGLQGLIGKPLALISDARLGNRSDGTVAVERLLSVSGEDTLTVDRKYKDHWTGRLPSRFMILTNELPRFTDSSGALASRFIIVVLSESFLGRENPRLSDELLREAPSIFNWCLDGLDRLNTRGFFREPDSSREAMRHLGDLASPVAAFVRDRCNIGPQHEVKKDDLWDAWKKWCLNEGRASPGTKAVFMRDLRAAFPGLKPKRLGAGGKEGHAVAGIRLLPERDPHSEAALHSPARGGSGAPVQGSAVASSTARTSGLHPEEEKFWAEQYACAIAPWAASRGEDKRAAEPDDPNAPVPGQEGYLDWLELEHKAGRVGAAERRAKRLRHLEAVCANEGQE